jgi:SprT protein
MNNHQMQAACREEIARCLAIARAAFPKASIPDPAIYWGTAASMKSTAGLAQWKPFSVELNMSLLSRNPEEFIHRTPAHEVAHLVAWCVYGTRISGHGGEWAHICRLFEIPAARYHNYRTSGDIIYDHAALYPDHRAAA